MSSEQIMLVAVIVAVIIAVVALTVALISMRKLAATQRHPVKGPGARVERKNIDEVAPQRTRTGRSTRQMVPLDGRERAPHRVESGPRVRVVEGRVVVAPTSRQVVEATMGHPVVRATVLLHGLAYALRPESRDRIRALMRREYHRSRTQRRRAGRQAARARTVSTPVADAVQSTGRHSALSGGETQAWMGEISSEPRQVRP